MPRHIAETELHGIEAILREQPGGVSFGFIRDALDNRVPDRTLRHRLRHLIDAGRVSAQGEGRGTKYRLATGAGKTTPEISGAELLPLSSRGKDVQLKVSQPLIARKVVGYNRDYLDSYRPNETQYLSEQERLRLHEIGTVPIGNQPAGTYARQILDRLLIDLSWNSSRLEGNTYSLLDTRELIEFGKQAEGKDRLEAQMILNHKDAIEFLVASASDIAFNRYTILNLHAILANNLLPNPQAAGRLRHIPVGITQSSFMPLEVPQLIEEYFHQILATANAIADPFEQSLFMLVQLPYLQPFEDVNKRVSRLAANIPMIKNNLIPLTFSDVPKELYSQAILGIYELNDVALLKDVYLWAYNRSAQRYAAVRQTIGEPDPFRMEHRENLRHVVGSVVRNRQDRASAIDFLKSWAETNLSADERFQFIDVAKTELLALHEGNFARYKIRPSEFEAWQQVWQRRP
jgi:hypothetical protein